MTSQSPALITWADAEGRGFAPLRTADTATSAAPEFWAVAERLLDDTVVQPVVRSTLEHPVYSLRTVTVPRHGRFWCFAEQGRGGPYGVAGTCRFKFEPYELGAQMAWSEGIAAVGGKEPLAAGDADEAGVRHALNGLLFGHHLLRIPGTPTEAVITIHALLGVLPDAIAAQYTWATCPLQEPRPSLVSANLPAEFRTGTPLDKVIDRVRWSTPPGTEAVARRLDTEARRSAFELLVDRAVRGHHDPELLAAPVETVEDLVEYIATTIAFPTPDNVASLLRNAEGRRRLAGFPHEVTRWAQTDPAAARQALARLREPVLRQAILLPLFDDLLGRGGDAAAAALVHEAEPDRERLAGAVREHRRAGRWSAPDSWLQTLGLSVWEYSDLYTDPTPALVAELTERGVTQRAWALLVDRGPAFARHVLTQMPKVRPSVGAGLIAAAAERPAEGAPLDDGDLLRLGPVLIARADHKPADQWLVEFYTATRQYPAPRPAVRQVLYGAVNDLLHRTHPRHPAPALVSLVRGAMTHSAQHHEAVPHAVQRMAESPRTMVPAPAEPAPEPEVTSPQRPRPWERIARVRREDALRWVAVGGAGVAVLTIVVWGVTHDGAQPDRQSASAPPAAKSASPSARTRTGAPPAADTIRVSWDGSQKATDKVLGDIRATVQRMAPRKVVYVLLAPAGPDPDEALRSARDLQAVLEQAELPELTGTVFVIPGSAPPVEQKATVELTFITEAR